MSPSQEQFTVSGLITQQHRAPAVGVTVRVYRVSLLGKESPLGAAKTTELGKYEVKFASESATTQYVSVKIKIFQTSRTRIALAESNPTWIRKANTKIDATIPSMQPEYTRINNKIRGFFAENGPEIRDPTEKQIEFIANAIDMPIDRMRTFFAARRFADQYNLLNSNAQSEQLYFSVLTRNPAATISSV